MEKRTVSQWHVWAKFKNPMIEEYYPGQQFSLQQANHAKTMFYHQDRWFSSKQAAEDYAKSLLGVEEWEVKEMIFTEEEARQEEEIVQIMARWKKQIEDREDKESRKKPTNLQ